ncbi:Gfo/Idh/MocA family protein [Ligilactobacillus salivarius]|uniref:Oxidoreductase n=1 Tax=Ligilactobacillus salivarius TaxID=1624 RepID=A0A1V9QSI9_9LACO|nr:MULTISPECIES: Gfo/Idh/MocA family oxidoreductase [Bacilli]MBD5790621.1 Gfo/Idh/MocA family oxidoreductase [Ligilactobacillus salivarius]MBM6788135.1 Gfo/Idh/MocA family oxidoreductase [Ligilactobacillus salivarius]MBZ4025920.1 Gfo/Idh/MocA family oxidoreductase [Ligilactobacillus salivarius]MDM8205658.1 Gfo/Idh/MocA family oxidoreductase [Ligilactobacillus salivarius]MDN4834472.1 Gfo/Idh/MocA family oxidoreductase [Ligilactobacillus salivarius]
MISDVVKYGVVGTGYFGAELARAMKDNKGAKIVAVFDPENGETIANELECEAVDTLDSLVTRDDIDCVIVATPNYLHKEPVIKAAQNHKNVFCEKPIALNYQDCVDMVNACKEAGVIFMAGHIMNFFNGVHHAKELINEGAIGDILFVKSVRNGWEEPQPSISWKKIREKSGGHLYHHIHELDCVQFIMGGLPTTVTMSASDVAHNGEQFGDEDDLIMMNLEFPGNRYAHLEWGSAFRWGEHYVLIEGTKGAIMLNMYDTGGTLRVNGKDTHFLIHESQEEDDDRTRIYHSTEMDGAIQYGHPGKLTPMWLHSLIVKEMKFLNDVLHGMEVPDEYKKLLDGTAAEEAIATADAATLSNIEDRKVKINEITK